MSVNKAVDNLTKNPLLLAGGVAIILYVLYSIAKGAVAGTARAAGGIVSGKNPITESARTDAFVGRGVVGTTGAATDIATGGVLSRTGEAIGATLFRWFGPPVNDWASEVHYAVTFPDGSRHAISSLSVNAAGFFNYENRLYRMAIDQSGNRRAFAQ